MKLEELSPTEDYVVDVIAAVIVVVTISLISHQTRVSQGLIPINVVKT